MWTARACAPGARLYVANGMVRIETPEAPAGFFLIDGAAGAAFSMQPAQQVFMDAKQSTRLTQIFVPVDSNDPCRQWQAAAKKAGVSSAGGEWRCGRIDTAIVDGRGTIEYRMGSPEQKSSRGWVDADLEFPIKLRAADGTTIALEHISSRSAAGESVHPAAGLSQVRPAGAHRPHQAQRRVGRTAIPLDELVARARKIARIDRKAS